MEEAGDGFQFKVAAAAADDDEVAAADDGFQLEVDDKDADGFHILQPDELANDGAEDAAAGFNLEVLFAEFFHSEEVEF